MIERKARYLEFCQSGYVPLHLQPWWLDAVCLSESWDVALAFDSGGTVVAALPWYKKRRWGLWVVQTPPLTTYAGPWLRYPDDPNLKRHSRYTFEKKVCSQLIKQLPRTAFFLQNFRPEVENWLPFYWERFRQSTRYTYILDAPFQTETITAGMKSTLRTNLKKAFKSAEWRQDDAAWDTVFKLNSLSFQRKNMQQPYELACFQRLHAALSQRGQMAVFLARDRDSNEPHAGLYLTFDNHLAYVLLTGTDPKHKASCAIYGLFMEAIQFCGARGLSLDFEGSMQPEIEHTLRALGARQQPYSQVWKAQNKLLEALFYLSR